MPRVKAIEDEVVDYIQVKVLSPGIKSAGKIYASVDNSKKGISHVSFNQIKFIDDSKKH
jgi:hypothetical protein